MSEDTTSEYDFYWDADDEGEASCRNPRFSVSFARYHEARYVDDFNTLDLSSDFEGNNVSASTNRLIRHIENDVPNVSKEEYALIVMQRIRAAGKWLEKDVVFWGEFMKERGVDYWAEFVSDFDPTQSS